MIKKIIKILRLLIVVILFIVVLVFVDDKYDQQKISINNIKIISSEERFINKQLITDILHQNLFLDSLRLSGFYGNNLEHVLELHPSLKNVEVFVDIEGSLDIEVEQKNPIVRIIGKESNYYLDEDGEFMPVSDQYTSKLLVVTGDVSTCDQKLVYEFAKVINSDQFWKSQITGIYIENNEAILIPRIGGHKIHFGSFKNIHKKLDNLYSFYTQAIPIKGWDRYTDINLKYKNQIVCTIK